MRSGGIEDQSEVTGNDTYEQNPCYTQRNPAYLNATEHQSHRNSESYQHHAVSHTGIEK